MTVWVISGQNISSFSFACTALTRDSYKELPYTFLSFIISLSLSLSHTRAHICNAMMSSTDSAEEFSREGWQRGAKS